MIDIDNFKKINDNYGHQMGDNILKDLPSIINSFIKKTDSATRFGGVEFTIILTHTAKDFDRIFVDRIINGIAVSKFRGFLHNEIVTVSAGLAGIQMMHIHKNL
jgi:diguanylate cyclase (GGDEF)-like protein